MIRLFHVYFPGRILVLAVSEVFVSALALLIATYIWFGKDADLAFRYDHGIVRIVLAALVCVLCMYYYDLYDTLATRNFRSVVVRVVQVLGTACVALSVIYFIYPDVQLGRGPVLVWVILATAMLLVWRWAYVAATGVKPLKQRAVLLGSGRLATMLAAEIGARPEVGLDLIGYVGPARSVESTPDVPRLADTASVADVVARERIHCVIVGMDDRRGQLPVEQLLRLKMKGVLVQDGVELFETLAAQVPVQALHLSSLLFSHGFRISTWILLYKRAVSVLLSVVGLALASPVMAIAATAIRLTSPGPVIFRQKRIGQGGKEFTLYKFRSMYADAVPDQPAQANDDRITRVGRWMRCCRVDELPQLYNILRGDMYFVGPRPFIPREEQELAEQIPFYCQRWAIKPGATGWAQVKNGYCTTTEDNIRKLGYDLFYIKNMSIGLDALILFHTLKILLLGRGAR